MEEDYAEGLSHILHCRKVNVRNLRVILLLMFGGGLISLVFPPAFLFQLLGGFLSGIPI